MLQRKGESFVSRLLGIRMLIREYRFGWTNASYLHGLSLLGLDAKRALLIGEPYDVNAKDEQNA